MMNFVYLLMIHPGQFDNPLNVQKTKRLEGGVSNFCIKNNILFLCSSSSDSSFFIQVKNKTKAQSV